MNKLPFPTTSNHIHDLLTAIEFYFDKAKGIWAAQLTDWKRPTYIVSQLVGTCGGKADLQGNKINVNFDLYRPNKEEYLTSTIPHEVAHLIAWQLYGYEGYQKMQDTEGHGIFWQGVMIKLGVVPNRYHKYDLSKVKTTKNIQKKRYVFLCHKCKKELLLTENQYNNRARLMCGCGGKIQYTFKTKLI